MKVTRLRGRLPRRLALPVSVALLLSVALVYPGLANLPNSTFDAGDGNLVLDDETQDWVNAPNRAVALDVTPARDDNSFGQGTKEDTPVPTVVTGSIPPNKSDLTRFYVANQRLAGKEFLYLAWERVQEPSGTTNMDFEFNQSRTLSGNGVTPVRTAGDVLIKYDLAQGGTNPILGFHRWVTSGNPATVCEANNSVPCWGPVQTLAGNFEGAINTVSVSDPVPPNAPRTLSPRTFGEAAINLTDSGILPPGQCEAFSGAYLKSRSSDSFTAAVKDFIAPVPVSLQNCGRIIIRKQTDPDGAAGSFDYTTTGGLDPATFSLADDGVQDYGAEVLAGSYTVTEADPTPGFDLVDITCTVTGENGSTATTDVAGRSVSIGLVANDTVDCTYTNRQRGTIIIRKQTDPDGAAGSFGYSTGGGLDPATFSLADDGVRTYSNLAAGDYSVTEADPAPAFDLSELTCTATSGSSGTTDLATRTASISLAAGGTVDCTYTNRQRGTIIIRKQTDPDGAAGTFNYSTGGGLDPATFSLADDGVRTYSGVSAGDYSVTEADPAPAFDLSELTCTATSGSSGTTDLATRTASISLAAGGTVDCTYTNRQRGTITVHKQDDAGNPLAGAVFTLFTDNPPLGGDPPHGAEDTSTGKSCTTGADGNCTITEVVPGRYWVVETTGVPGHDTAADQNVVVGAGETVGPLTFVDPRQHVVIVLVCHQGTNTLAASEVTNGASQAVSLSAPPEGITEAQLCGLGGARFENLPHGEKNLSVNVGSNAHPI